MLPSTFQDKMQKQIESYNHMVEKEGKDSEEVKKAYRAASEGILKQWCVLTRKTVLCCFDAPKLDKVIDDLDAKIGDSWRLLDRDYDGKLTSEEEEAAMYLKDTLGREGVQEHLLAIFPKAQTSISFFIFFIFISSTNALINKIRRVKAP
ncbi:hypothetical protein Sjap_019084 [Stephania japonica]|uniref:EF-hand domain-containing protein n=1 Tax=Stephania japonica TaxID=461633 RepID=A0AAP0EY16_9MAGN